MKIIKDNRIEEFKRIEQLLYGINYCVWVNLYGPLNPDLGLEEAIKENVSKEAVLSGVIPSSIDEAKSEILDMLLYEGDIGSGPIDLDNKREEITELISRVFALININGADIISSFGLREGHPAYPVFWDFAFDIHSGGKRWIFMGSSSD